MGIAANSVLAGMRQFNMQSGCCSVPWQGSPPRELVIRVQVGRSGRSAKTVDCRLAPVSIDQLDEARQDQQKAELVGIPTMFAYRPTIDRGLADGYVELFPAPSSDFLAGFVL